MAMYHILTWRLLQREASWAVAIYCFGLQKKIYEWTSWAYIYWYHSAGMPSTSRHKCTHHQLYFCMSHQVYTCLYITDSLLALSVAQLSHSKSAVTSTYLLPQWTTKYVSTYLNDDNLKPEVKIGTPSVHTVLNEVQWYILVTFKSNIPKNEVQRTWWQPTYPVSVLCTVYPHHEWQHSSASKQTRLVATHGLESACIDTEVIKYGRLQNELVEWCNNCFDCKSFCTPPNTNAIHFKKL